ncbi:MAG: universal stress protein [Chthoniobacterales bacterium]
MKTGSEGEQAKQSAALDLNAPLQMKTILVPLDFSHASLHALKYSLALGKEFKAGIHLIHVQPGADLTEVTHARHFMLNCADAVALMQERLAEVEGKHDVKFRPDNCHIVSGRPYVEICKLARELRVDLIILPTRGNSGLKHLALGSTAERVVRHAPCPVLVPRGEKFETTIWRSEPADTFRLRKILVPVDFSECSVAGLKYAALLARHFAAQLRLFHAVVPSAQTLAADRMGNGGPPPAPDDASTRVAQEMGKLAQLECLRGVRCETRIRVGSAVEEICAQSTRPEIDRVVTSTHGRTGLEHALIGSVAEHVVRSAQAPVLIVPSAEST